METAAGGLLLTCGGDAAGTQEPDGRYLRGGAGRTLPRTDTATGRAPRLRVMPGVAAVRRTAASGDGFRALGRDGSQQVVESR